MKNYCLFILCFLFLASIAAQDLQVVETYPAPQSMIASPAGEILVTFNQEPDMTSINPGSFRVFGKWSGPMEGTYNLSAGTNTVKFSPQRPLFYGEWITVRLSGDIQSSSGMPLSNGFNYEFWTKSLPASLDLEYGGEINMRQSGEGALTCYGAYAGDVNNDEYSDLVVITEDSDDIRVMISDGSTGYGPFVIIEMPPGLGPSTNEGADFNRDGLIDMAIGSTYANNVNIQLGDPVTFFNSQMNYQASEGVRGLAVADLNGDGWDDIVTANRADSNMSILMNDGTGLFQPAVNIDSGFDGETSIATTDLNNDGFTDLLVATHDDNNVVSLLNDGSGNMTVTSNAGVGGGPWMLAIGDINGDGFVDAITANRFTNDVSVVFSDGSGGVDLDRHYSVNTFPVAIDLGDIDGDGDLDFISSNVLGGDYTLMENDGTGQFINARVYPSPDMSACAVIHDRNNDGAMDITMIDEAADVVILYNNTLLLNNEDRLRENHLSLYPNPFYDTINASGDIHGEVKLILYDAQGRLLLSENMSVSKRFDLSDYALSEGSYIAHLFYNDTSQKIKLIKISH
ncbi:MAG: VCBS repeat-containing protein [Bacteroidia bacterium]|nr:VCBS repeat-containing protein [Bacteroidia bacterium]NNF31153.1 T9SS type A sorting domain-containing protein [Flavobacteriaceae bacterium]MBT8274855.1 VCBS repeat-containing protein [Bacteroidia bacterium]NNJ81133.1 T9SS type A sorting domain-containing protein [Flavobacteriaceae bacterium]NNK54583.1 T9SS type A sorting domain-containing protein [Flavobacteriaceae bacterium]